MKRYDDRQYDELRPVSYLKDFIDYPEGSVLISQGNTKVLCNVTIQEGIPRWMMDQEKPGGWITAEYALMPRSTQTRTARETRGLKGRTQEIRRMIGRSLRAAFNLTHLDGYTCIVDCDVLQADGGTRTASITGGYLALRSAIDQMVKIGKISENVFLPRIAAVSVGIIGGEHLLDLCYQEDSIADVDINVVMNEAGEYIEIQGTAEGAPFSAESLNILLGLAEKGIFKLIAEQISEIG